MDSFTSLKWLFLDRNYIKEIKGLENLKNLRVLRLEKNQIKTIIGLESLVNLQKHNLEHNSLSDNLVKGLGGLNVEGFVYSPKKFVEYCKK